ncbi:MAG TPA: group 1 truncated hemoglobin [Candidatus Nitrosotenuis sp.]|nr:group 1 truncated hemoglobin [Candidatus Nitrosotenuis sp.]
MRQLITAALIAPVVLAAALPCRAEPQEASSSGSQSLYQRLGGLYPIAALVNDFIDRLATDEVISQNAQVRAALPAEKLPGLKVLATNLLVQAAGGPGIYSGRSMKESHMCLEITGAQWEAAVAQFQAAMDGQSIPAELQKELLALVGSLRADIVSRP